jgi:cytochrome c oxidase subunit 2
MVHDSVWLISTALMGLLLAVFAFVYFRSHTRQEDYTPLQTRAYRLRTSVFWVLALTLGPTMIYNLFDLPYDKSHGEPARSTPPQIIQATGYQWRWELSRNEVAVGQPVEFHITAADVNHGFGIYDTHLHLVAQAQAMPGYTNIVRHTFDTEGTYRILCMEYCGLAHTTWWLKSRW